MNSNYSNKLKNRYLLIIGFIFFLALIFRGYYDVKHHRSMIDSQMKEFHKNALVQYHNFITSIEKRYTSVAYQFINLQEIHDPIKYKKRELLYESLKDDYQKLQTLNPNLYVMHIQDTTNTTVMRMHKPSSYGDDLTNIRPMVALTNQEKKAHFGFETGKNGITYRIAIPFITRGNEHLGVLEFGIKPQYFASKMSALLDAESQVIVKTSSMEYLQIKKDLKHLGDFSIVLENHFFDKIKEKIDLSKKTQIVEIEQRTYLLLNDLSLDDYSGEIVAKILIAKDITKKVTKNKTSIIFTNLLNLIILLICFTLIYVIFTKYTNNLKKAYANIDKLEVEVETDALTGINNRTSLNSFLKNIVTNPNDYAIIFFDIDHFKEINDTYGHDVGDIILKELTTVIGKDLRSDDFFARWGGEEFAIVLRTRNIESVLKITQKIKDDISSTHFHKKIKLTCSFGVTMVDNPQKMDEVFKRADELLYEAKNAGRDCIKYR